MRARSCGRVRVSALGRGGTGGAYLGERDREAQPAAFPGAREAAHEPAEGVRHVRRVELVQAVALLLLRVARVFIFVVDLALLRRRLRRLPRGELGLEVLECADELDRGVDALLLLRRGQMPEQR